jgi:hypothetical protein
MQSRDETDLLCVARALRIPNHDGGHDLMEVVRRYAVVLPA